MKFLSNLTLGKRIIFLTSLGLIVAVGVFSFLGMRAVNQATEAMLQDRMTTAHVVADYLDEALGRALAELKNVAQLIEMNEANVSIESHIEALDEMYQRLSIYTHSIYLINEQGQIIWSEPKVPSVLDNNIAFYHDINQAIKSGNATTSGLVMAPETDTPVIFLISPIKGSRMVLAVAVDLAQSQISGFIKPIRLGETGYVEIVDQNGVVVARTEPGPKLAPFERSDHSGRFAALISAGEPTRGLCHTCHEPVAKVEKKDVLAFVPLSEARWGVIIRQSEDEALAPIRQLRQSLFLFGVGLVTLALLFVTITTRDVVSRLRMLTVASRKIAGGDLLSVVTSSGKDEVSVLAQSLDDMRLKLKTSYGELKQRTEELSSLLSMSEILTSLHDLSNLDVALGSALDKTLEIMKVNAGGILLWDDERQELCYRVHHGLSKENVQGVCCRLGEGIAGKVAQTGEAILIKDVSAASRITYPDLVVAEGLGVLASVPLSSKDKVLGVLSIGNNGRREFSSEDIHLLNSIAAQIAIAVENAKLHQEVQREDKIRGELLQQIFLVQEEERRRIARELHDETSQVMASLNANLEAASGMLPDSAKKTKALLKKSQDLSINILEELHRLIYELRPTLLDDLGLVAAIRWLIDNNLEPAGIKVAFKTTGRLRRLGLRVETTLFRVIQEAFYNIAKHAGAANVEMRLHFKKSVIGVHIRDDGKGFDVAEAMSSKDRPRGLGLLGMKERVELVNGTFNIDSNTTGGTEINIEIPLSQEVDNG